MANLKSIKGVSVCTFLADRQVAERQAKAAQDYLSQNGYRADIQVVNDQSNPIQKGSSIVLWAETDTGVIIGADAIGELRKMAKLWEKKPQKNSSLNYLLSQRLMFSWRTCLFLTWRWPRANQFFLLRTISEHIESNIWLMEKMLNVKFTIEKVNNLYRIEKS